MQEILAYLVLFGWPFVSLFAYLKFDTVTATFVTIVGGYLLLPVGLEVDLPLIPSLDKTNIPNLSALLSIVLVKRQKFYFLTNIKWVKFVIVCIVLIPIINVYFNLQPIYNGEFWLPSLTLHDGISNSLLVYLRLLPLIISVNIIKSEYELTKLLKLLVWSLILYCPLIFLELRLSPQLHNWVYGYFPHSFAQQVREGGFRAVVFLGHGLLTANIYLGGFIALAILYKSKRYFQSAKVNLNLLVFFFLMIILLKSMTAIMLACSAIVLITISKKSYSVIPMRFVALFIMAYPVMSYFNMIPYEVIHNWLAEYNAERAQSLYFRFSNEDVLMDYLGERFLIGNGGSRMMLYGAIVDGTWIIWTLSFGVIYTTLNFLLFAGSLFIARTNKNHRELNIYCVFVTVMMIDQIPNSSLGHSWLWLYGGAILAYSAMEAHRKQL
ncbi:hypothetical protein NQT74_01920 [Alteromonas stellipolaris]|uniref:hypothetical protein n=1 Tax=Alteromonas stellipolaris TaxID=233316 RepID=UPI0021180257|nr:hypothetical protein [Alteromonas stellipolaris]MCQ8847333.1 hypothetical protein [Alteromonas stellipolaris]